MLNLAHSWNICLDSTDTTESNVYVWSHLSPWGFFAFHCSIQPQPLAKGSFGPFCLDSFLLLLYLQGTTHALALSLSLPFQVCSRSELLYSLGLVFPRGSCLYKAVWFAAASGAGTFQFFLHAIQVQTRHESTFHASLAKKHSKAIFCSQKIYLSLTCIILLKTAQAVTHLLLFCVWPVPIPILQVSGNRYYLVHILASPFCGLAFARLQGMFWFFKQNWRMH